MRAALLIAGLLLFGAVIVPTATAAPPVCKDLAAGGFGGTSFSTGTCGTSVEVRAYECVHDGYWTEVQRGGVSVRVYQCGPGRA